MWLVESKFRELSLFNRTKWTGNSPIICLSIHKINKIIWFHTVQCLGCHIKNAGNTGVLYLAFIHILMLPRLSRKLLTLLWFPWKWNLCFVNGYLQYQKQDGIAANLTRPNRGAGNAILNTRGKLLQLISLHPMDQQGSSCCGSLDGWLESYDSKVTSVGLMDAEKLAKEVLLYVFDIELPASL